MVLFLDTSQQSLYILVFDEMTNMRVLGNDGR